MADGFLSTNDLAKRWGLRSGTLSRWRQYGTGPTFLKFGKAVRYRLEDVIEYELRSLKNPSISNHAEVAVGEPAVEPSKLTPKLTIKDVVAEIHLGNSLPVHLLPDLVGAVDPLVGLPDALDFGH